MNELARQLSVNPSEIIYAVTMETVLSAIVKRMGKKAHSLTPEDLQLAKEEMVIWGRSNFILLGAPVINQFIGFRT